MRARTTLLRPGRPGDADTLAWIATVSRAAYFGRVPAALDSTPRPAPEHVARWRSRLLAPAPAMVLVAELAAESVGTAAVAATGDPAVLRLEGFYVLPHLWSRGIGRQLHAAVLAHAAAVGAERLTADVWDADPRGRRFHLAAGWQDDGRVRPGPGGTRFVGMQVAVRPAPEPPPLRF